MNHDRQADELFCVLWAAFGAGAGMPVDLACVSAARGKGYFEQVRSNADLFRSDPARLGEAERCCLRAGHLAAERAIQDGRESIGVDDFLYGCDTVEQRIGPIRQRALQRAESEIVVLGGVCAAL
jgi:hypothetical protein